jgi:hypothetical protein
MFQKNLETFGMDIPKSLFRIKMSQCFGIGNHNSGSSQCIGNSVDRAVLVCPLFKYSVRIGRGQGKEARAKKKAMARWSAKRCAIVQTTMAKVGSDDNVQESYQYQRDHDI